MILCESSKRKRDREATEDDTRRASHAAGEYIDPFCTPHQPTVEEVLGEIQRLPKCLEERDGRIEVKP